MEDIRSFNVGASDYAQHKYQSWDFWITFRLNPFDADLCKRILRTKASDGRLMDYQKIKHICGERIRQLSIMSDPWPIPLEVEKSFFIEMIADYNLCEDDVGLLTVLLFRTLGSRAEEYKLMQDICDKRIKELNDNED